MTRKTLREISRTALDKQQGDPQYQRELTSYLAGFLTPHRKDLLQRLILERTRHLTVVVEDICHAHNTSACVRSCDCFGIQDFHVIENRNRFDVAVDIARGATQWLTMHRHNYSESQPDSTRACIEKLRADGYQIVVASPHDANCELETYDISKPTALLFGNEKEGVSPNAMQLATHIMRVPMYGFTESFNISVAVAVCLHHLVWRMRQLNIDWQLSPSEREELLHDWVRISTGHRLKALVKRFDDDRASGDRMGQHEPWPDWNTVLTVFNAHSAT
ncbi:MAG: RNA methyltransferase [Planctomycetota bacterium]|nr:RNA methyltransferase [Planctomycetota bacterium]MDA0919308.1 RNA methyltransferase [Planctomycetota bacterium]